MRLLWLLDHLFCYVENRRKRYKRKKSKKLNWADEEELSTPGWRLLCVRPVGIWQSEAEQSDLRTWGLYLECSESQNLIVKGSAVGNWVSYCTRVSFHIISCINSFQLVGIWSWTQSEAVSLKKRAVWSLGYNGATNHHHHHFQCHQLKQLQLGF